MSLNFTAASLKFNPLTIFEGKCNIQSDISAAGVRNSNPPWSILAHSAVQLDRSVSLSVFLIMYRQKPGEWPDFTVCQRLDGQCGPKLKQASAQLYKTLVMTELGAERSHVTHRIRPHELLGQGSGWPPPQFNFSISPMICMNVSTFAMYAQDKNRGLNILRSITISS